ncbi:DUF2505 domain-containing protein [Modestobacter sp. VKM Ac-2986]|uniref:DUF2505 domain-containing protein n=1 Tax=Modestobacter sp. VKM Ac-2986 TaxID=3004140 RepID=UPI0022AA0E54|nr:DUF2505 domain-containing protein [Modestobacter sp. VKM Ac-2986]MCZ2828475.1 DUF2505 domain-containing protein [Modestobacter sp. VKM Ac-2986]
MPLDSSVSYPASPDTVLAVLTDEQFLRDRAAALDAQVQEVTVSGSATTTRLSAPTAGIPPVFARFVGSSVAVVERSTWTPDGEGGHRSPLDVQSEVFGREVRVTGERRLRPEAGGTRATVTGDVRVDAPLVGRQAENAVRELMTVVLRKEDELIRARLA